MKRIGKKEQKQIIFNLIAEKVQKYYGIYDDPCFIQIRSIPSGRAFYNFKECIRINGRFNIVKHYIAIRLCDDKETLAHELAHYVQYVQENRTCCMSVFGKKTFNKDVYSRHRKLEKEIFELIKDQK
jgi:hypothetical protein